LNIRNVDEVDISSSANITNLNTKILKLKGNGAVYQMGGTINVSNTLDITSNLGVVNSFSSNSNGNQSIINYNNPLCVDYISIKDINFTNTTTVTAGPNSVNNGNNLGVEFFTDNNITIQAFTINSSMGTSIADFEESSFTATSTSGFDQNMIFNWYVDNILKQSGPSISFSPGLITENYTVECATEIPYNGGQGNSSCSFVVKAKSNSINMSVSSKPIIKETKITQDNQYIKVRFSKPVFTNSNGTGELTANDFRLYLNGGNATLSGSYPNSVVKDGDFYKLTFGLNGKFNGEEEITVKPNGNSNIYDNQGQGAEQDNQSNNTVKLNYNPPIIDGVSVNSALNELTIVFSEPVNGSDQSPYNVPLKYNVLHLSVSGGSATLNSPLPNSISGNLDTYKVGFTLSGTPNGNEIFQVTPVFNSIFDLQGFPASHLQDYNTTCTNCDSDNDGVIDARDTCPNTVSGTTVDQNGCSDDQKDSDYDGVPDYLDYCLNTVLGTEVNANGCAETQTNQQSPPTQVNNSSSQNESTLEVVEVNPEDLDGDGYLNSVDAFPNDPSEYLDTDVDGIGDNADQDDDNDGFTDSDEALCKTNPKDSNSLPTDNDGDQIVDCIDTDDDNDGVEDKRDAFPMDDSEYLDTDKDGIGNNADEDDDGDGYKDQDEIACESDPLKRFSKPRDYDGDLIPDCIDTDDDDDGCLDEQDLFPLNERECEDSDGDGIGDNSDIDADNDGIIDEFDDFPTDPNESKDTDGDGIGDNADLDDNNDGFPEDPVINSAGEEVIPIFVSGLLTPNQTGEESKWRIVNIDKYPTANVKIYSPSGEVVYESWSYNNDWDGKDKNGKPLPTGPYLYIIDRGVETLVEEGWLYIYN
jgi:gliding motility-associated-like protein